MARGRAKKRTHAGAKKDAANPPTKNPMGRSPKSMVIRMGAGEVGPSVSQLVKDMRKVMEPGTASRLQERRGNKLRDFTTMCGPLGVTHLLLFSRSKAGNTNMRLALFPRGPTFHFRVAKYSLCKDIIKSMKRPKAGEDIDFLTPPLLVMNNFLTQPNTDGDKEEEHNPNAVPKQLESLSTSVFQSLFPSISPQTTPLSSIRRVLLLNREQHPPPSSSDATKAPSDTSDHGRYVINLRHYAISTPISRSARAEIPRSIRKLQNAGTTHSKSTGKKSTLPDLGRLHDVSEYLLDPSAVGYTSVSESDGETEAEVEVAVPLERKALSQKERERLRARREAASAATQSVVDGEDEEGEEKADGDETKPNGNGTGIRSGPRVEQRAVKLTELGPRMQLRLVKVEEGLCEGKVMWHEFVEKTEEEVKRMDKDWERRRREKEARKKQQRENVERKKREKEEAKADKHGRGEGGEDEDEEMLTEEADDLDDWEDEYDDADNMDVDNEEPEAGEEEEQR